MFINAYRVQRFGSPLPTVTSVVTMPVILPDGTMLSGHRLDRARRILFRVNLGLEAMLPAPEDCTPDAVAEAMAFLTGVWLVDVPCNYTDKVKLIALALTILERAILPARPGYFITAGRRGNGKTTVLMMLAWAALGEMVSASAWSPLAEERRKSLLAYMGDGAPLIAWDNIPRGSTITCPHIDRALTSHTYTDSASSASPRTAPCQPSPSMPGPATTSDQKATPRRARRPSASAPTDQTRRTGASRTRIRSPGPMPIVAGILRALYTVLLGNPRLTGDDTTPRQTRFKVWHHLIGAALEHAAIWHRDRVAEHDPNCPPVAVAFKDQFLANEDDDELDHALATVLRMLCARWPGGSFSAAELANWISDGYDPAALTYAREFLPALDAATEKAPPHNNHYSAMVMAFRLRSIHDAPTKVDYPDGNSKVLCLRYDPNHEGGTYSVAELRL